MQTKVQGAVAPDDDIAHLGGVGKPAMAVVSGQGFEVAVIADASRPAALLSDDDLLAIARELAVRAEPLLQ